MEIQMLNRTAALTLSMASWAALAQSPVETDGDKYKVVMENEQVRVLKYRDLPGEKTHQHAHPAFVLYAVSAFHRKIHLPDGKVLMRDFKPGDVMYSPAQVHIGENVGTTPTHVIMVELKTAARP
jgi:hypothetical protein